MTPDCYARNMAALKQRNPDLASRVENASCERYHAIPSMREGIPNLRHTESLSTIVFYDNRNPLKDVETFLDALLTHPPRFVVQLGLGLGYVAEALLQRSSVLKLIVVEKDLACLKTALKSRDLTDLIEDNRCVLIASCETQDLYVILNNAVRPHHAGQKELQFVPWPAAVRIAEDYYHQVVSTFRTIADTYGSDRGNDPYDTLVGYEQFFANIGDLMKHPGADYFRDFFKNRPAVVVATGPSLKKNIHLLKEIENSALIISADASLRILHQHNIFPHLVTTTERPPGFDVHYKGVEHLDKTVFAAASFLHPSTIKAYTGPILFFHRIYAFMIHLGFERDTIYMGISTAHMAYEVARHMGCNPIILIGQDLAYDDTGNTHAPGFILGERQSLFAEFDKINVPGNIQPVVQTCDGWFTGIKQYEKRIDGWDGRLINATEGGARIRGTEIATLREVIDEYCTAAFYPREALRDRMAQWINPRTPQELLKVVNHFIDVNDTMLEICRDMRSLLDACLREIESQKELSSGLRNKMDQIVPNIGVALESITKTELMRYFDEYLFTDIFPLLMEWQIIETRFKDPDWANAYRIKMAEDFFGGLGQLCISLKEVLLDGQRRLEPMS